MFLSTFTFATTKIAAFLLIFLPSCCLIQTSLSVSQWPQELSSANRCSLCTFPLKREPTSPKLNSLSSSCLSPCLSVLSLSICPLFKCADIRLGLCVAAGLDAELFYVRDDVVNLYALSFILPVPSDTSSLHFTWYSKAKVSTSNCTPGHQVGDIGVGITA